MGHITRGIPTNFQGIRFRSRLEATWARFFDSLGWKWEYEPVDFNGWIPDFGLYGKNQKIYVEVKPVVCFPKDVSEKLEASGCLDEILIVGETMPCSSIDGDEWDSVILGWLGENEKYEEDCGFWWQDAVFGRWEDGKGKIGFCVSTGRYVDRISGGYDGGCHGTGEVSLSEVRSLWASAKNKAQWNGGMRP